MKSLAKSFWRALIEHSPWRERLFWRLPSGGCRIALTFDDGPDPVGTPLILDVLAAYGASATFFVLGEAVERHPEIVRRIVDEGHTLANHTHCHARCDGLSWPELQLELERADGAAAAAVASMPAGTGQRMTLFRPPFGRLPLRHTLRLIAQGRRIALWSRDSRDYRGATARQIRGLAPALRDGDILLFHDRFPATAEALPALLEAARERGLTGVSLDPKPAALDEAETGSRVRAAHRRAPV